jgi:hypothetical protein
MGHPKSTGIIIITIELTVMVATYSSYYPRGFPQDITVWLLQVLGYVAIAKHEDWSLLKKFGDSYRQYGQRVPFLFSIKNPKGISETCFTVLLALLIWVVLWFLPV